MCLKLYCGTLRWHLDAINQVMVPKRRGTLLLVAWTEICQFSIFLWLMPFVLLVKAQKKHSAEALEHNLRSGTSCTWEVGRRKVTCLHWEVSQPRSVQVLAPKVLPFSVTSWNLLLCYCILRTCVPPWVIEDVCKINEKWGIHIHTLHIYI